MRFSFHTSNPITMTKINDPHLLLETQPLLCFCTSAPGGEQQEVKTPGWETGSSSSAAQRSQEPLEKQRQQQPDICIQPLD